MSADTLTRPERAAQIRQARRYAAAIARRGTCFACRNRSAVKLWGQTVCRVGEARVYPACQRDGLGVGFEFDDKVLEEFRDAQG